MLYLLQQNKENLITRKNCIEFFKPLVCVKNPHSPTKKELQTIKASISKHEPLDIEAFKEHIKNNKPIIKINA